MNEMEWDGFTTLSLQVKCQPPSHSSIICKIYKILPTCVATYQARIYYVSSGDHMTRVSWVPPVSSEEWRIPGL